MQIYYFHGLNLCFVNQKYKIQETFLESNSMSWMTIDHADTRAKFQV